jgi:hypothetical protein
MHPHPFRFVATAARGVAGPLSAALAGAAAATVATVAVVPSAPPAGAAAPSAHSTYDTAMTNIAHQGVHFESVASQSGTTLRVIGDTGTNSGAQTLTVIKGSTSVRLNVKMVGSTGYVKGDSTALHYLFSVGSAKASKYAGQWLSFPTSNASLASLVAGLKSSEVASGIQMDGPYKYGAAQTIDGKRALAVRGTAHVQGGSKVPVVLYVNASGTPRPLRQVTNSGSTSSSAVQGTVDFSNWGEDNTETAPAHSVSLLKVAPHSSSGSSSSGSSSSGSSG